MNMFLLDIEIKEGYSSFPPPHPLHQYQHDQLVLPMFDKTTPGLRYDCTVLYSTVYHSLLLSVMPDILDNNIPLPVS